MSGFVIISQVIGRGGWVYGIVKRLTENIVFDEMYNVWSGMSNHLTQLSTAAAVICS